MFAESIRLPRSWGRAGRRLTSRVVTKAVGTDETEGCGATGVYGPKADK